MPESLFLVQLIRRKPGRCCKWFKGEAEGHMYVYIQDGANK